MVKCALLIDGGYFLKRLPTVQPDIDHGNPAAVAESMAQLTKSHLEQLNTVWRAPNAYQLHYRTFYYDAKPYDRKAHKPVSHALIDYSRTEEARFREQLFRALHGFRNFAVRLGEVRRQGDQSWILRGQSQKELLSGRIQAEDLTDDDFAPALR